MLTRFKSIYFVRILLVVALIEIAAIVLINNIQSRYVLEQNEIPVSSRYISDYQQDQPDLTTSTVLDKEPTIIVDTNLTQEKSGVIEETQSRQVIKFNTDLTQQQKTELENEYNISFTNDVASNGVYVVNTTSNSNITAIESNSLTESIETDKPVMLLAQTTDWGVSRIGVDKVWSKSSGSGVVVAVIDTGVQIDHEDLSANMVNGYDFVNNDSNAYDDNGHGTHVAGIVAAHNNGGGTVGVANNSKIMPVKVLNAQGYGYLSDVAKGIYFAADNNARIINLSLGANFDSSTLREAVRYASRKGVIVVGAAGNSYGATCVYPAAYEEAICVMATDKDNKLASFSNLGGDISAPGVSNYSSYLGNRYTYLSGTSMAAPHVSASLAVIMSYCSNCTSSEVKQILFDTATDLGEAGKDAYFGYGLVDNISAVGSIDGDTTPDEQDDENDSDTTKDAKENSSSNANSRSNDNPSQNKPNQSTKPSFLPQDLIITYPNIQDDKKLTVESKNDIMLKFKLEPESSNSDLNKIVVYVDNSEVYSGNAQSGEYVLKMAEMTNNQYIVRVIAFFNGSAQQQKMFILDMTKLKAVENNNKANPNNPSNKRVLGISTSFEY